ARETAAALNEEIFLTWLDKDGAETANLSYKMVWNRSAFVANWILGDVGLAPGDRAVLVYAPGPEFFVAFVACLRAGVLAVPNYPPDPSGLGRGLRKLDLVRTTCGAEVGLTDSIVRNLRMATSIWHAWPAIRWHNTDGLGADSPLLFHRLMSSEEQQPDDPMLRVSRSSSSKKNDEGAAARYRMVNFSPVSFLADPLMWLRAVSKYRAIWTASPDFGYRLCTKRAADTDVSDIDLSCLVYCAGGVGQRCVPSLLREFAAYFAIHARLPDDGSRGIFVPNYGLAEHVVATCGENDGLVASRRRPDLISCGSDFIVDVRIVDAANRRRIVADNTPGELWLSSDSVAQGYWGKPELSDETFRARLEPDDGKVYLRTGDEAFVERGRLFICARIKDLIIVGGTNYYSDDVEVAATEAIIDSARPGCVAAFAVVDDDDEREFLCVVLEVRDNAESECEALAAALATRVGEAVGLRPRRVVFIKQKTILKTTSGKLRRRAIRDALLAGELR
ncbi:hypothetical protein CTAYLR_003331, partial [Chrysophaeum taylorii]